MRRSEYPVNDFALDQLAEKRYILGSIENLDEPSASPQQSCRGPTYSNSPPLRRDQTDGPVNDAIDDAYRAKYKGSPYLSPMIGKSARSATVKVMPREIKA